MSPDGGSLVFSTFLCGNGTDFPTGIALDPAGNIYVAGTTGSGDFPTVNPLQPVSHTNPFGKTGFVSKLTADGTHLIYSTYLGGSINDAISGLAVDGQGNAYVTGVTTSVDFPTTPGVLQPQRGNVICLTEFCTDAFVAKINAAGSALVYSTYLYGEGDDSGSGIAVDAAGNAYVVGTTSSLFFPVLDAFQPTSKVRGPSDAFVAKLNADGTRLLYSSYLGGSGGDEPADGSRRGLGHRHRRRRQCLCRGLHEVVRFPDDPRRLPDDHRRRRLRLLRRPVRRCLRREDHGRRTRPGARDPRQRDAGRNGAGWHPDRDVGRGPDTDHGRLPPSLRSRLGQRNVRRLLADRRRRGRHHDVHASRRTRVRHVRDPSAEHGSGFLQPAGGGGSDPADPRRPHRPRRRRPRGGEHRDDSRPAGRRPTRRGDGHREEPGQPRRRRLFRGLLQGSRPPRLVRASSAMSGARSLRSLPARARSAPAPSPTPPRGHSARGRRSTPRRPWRNPAKPTTCPGHAR